MKKTENTEEDFFSDLDTNDNPQGGGMSEAAAKKRSPLSKRTKGILIGVGAAALAAVFFLVGWFSRFYAIDERERTLMWFIDAVENKYYKELDDDWWDSFYSDTLDRLMPDKFCSYYTPEQYVTLQQESAGSNKDTGLSAIDYEGELRVYKVVNNSPACLAGLKSGMRIYRFGSSETDLQTGSRSEFYSYRPTGGALYLECGYSESDKTVYSITSETYLASYCLYRDSETSFEFRTSESGALVLEETNNPLAGLDENTAYLKFDQFNGNADSEFEILLKAMKSRKRSNLVIDLRMNGGGQLSTLQSICSHLLRNAEGNSPVVATAKYRSGSVTRFNATGNDFSEYFSANSRVYILADENSASASECLMGALVDYGTLNYEDIFLRKTEGEQAHSYGKGVMQTTYPAANGYALRITHAEIFWPNGKSIHGVGVTERVETESGGKGDGATGVVAPLLPGGTDTMLESVLAIVCS